MTPNTKPNTKPASKRPTIDVASAFANLAANAQGVTDSRFAKATSILASQPSVFASPGTEQAAVGQPLSGANSDSQDTSSEFNVATCVIGQTYDVPIHLIDPNPYGARHFYLATNVEQLVEALIADQQSVALNGFIKGNRVELIDGGSRLKAAKSAGFSTLQVKIEKSPESPKEQYKRSAQLNEQRSGHTALDKAFMFKRLLDEKVYASATELAADQQDEDGKPMSKQTMSSYMRIAEIPERFMKKMADHPQTALLTIAHEIGEIFKRKEYASDPERHDQIAADVIKHVQEKELSKVETRALIAAKLDGPKTRESALSNDVRYSDKVGKIKVFPERGEFQLLLNGLNQAQLDDVKARVERALSNQMSI